MIVRIGLAAVFALGLVATPMAVSAQPAARVPRVGTLSLSTDPGTATSSLRGDLAALGYIEGKTIVFYHRFAEGRTERLPALAAELVQLNVDVIVAWGIEPLKAVRKVTSRIPIVMMAGSNPVGTEVAGSLARPGGNITGVTVGQAELAGKRLQLLREVLPRLSRVAILWDPDADPALLSETESAARALNLRPLVVTLHAPGEFKGAFRTAVKARVEAALINETSMLTTHRATLAELATRNRLPSIGSWKSSPEAGLLMSYGPERFDLFRRVATYIDKILKGAKPGDLPIEQPTKFELVINLKTAKALDLKIPPSLLQRADQVIQ